MNKIKYSLSGMGAYGMDSSIYNGWESWVTTVLLWALMLLSIIAIAKYISNK